MPRHAVSTSAAPKAIGPYSQAVVTSGRKTIYCSGQIPIDPATGDMVGAGDVKEQTHRVMQNLAAVLKAAGGSLEAVARTTIFLTDLQDFAHVNEVYGGYFTGAPPARATVQVTALPKGARVEIDAIAVVDE
jgi:2-iminobutanoate/2-iminopropanoate deaminase